MDWKDQTQKDVITVQMLDPISYKVRGELKDVVLSKSSLTAGYYTDTRTGGTITVQGTGYVRGSFIRVIHERGEWKNTLGTYIVSDDDMERHHGVWEQQLTLQSILYGLSTDLLTGPFTIAKGGYGLAGIKKLLSSRERKAVYGKCTDHAYSQEAKVYETGTSVLSVLFDLCSTTGNRLDVDSSGRVTVSQYVLPSSKSASHDIDLSDARGIALDNVKLNTDHLSVPTNAIVSFTYREDGDEKDREIRAVYSASGKSHAARANRGYTVSVFQHLDELSPQSQDAANRKAKELYLGDSVELVEWQLETMYLPIWEGDTVNLIIPDGLSDYSGKRHCLVKSLDLDLADMKMKLTLKETKSGDADER